MNRSFKAGDDQLATDILPTDTVANLIRATSAETASYTSQKAQQQSSWLAGSTSGAAVDTGIPLLLKGGELARMKLNLTSFIVMLCAVAMQAFPDERLESRMHKIVEWLRQNEPESSSSSNSSSGSRSSMTQHHQLY